MHTIKKIISLLLIVFISSVGHSQAYKTCCGNEGSASETCESIAELFPCPEWSDFINSLVEVPENLDNDPENECIRDVKYEKGVLVISECKDWEIELENNIKGTRAQVLSLINTSSLIPGCTYSVSNYSRGCLAGHVECITLEAVSEGKVSMEAYVSTDFDNVAWEGRYDINTNRIVELQDNQGNHVSGRVGNEVDRFAWGQSNVWGNEIHSADVYMDCEPQINIIENSWVANSYTDLRGASGVGLYENSFDSYGRLYLNGASLIDVRRNAFQSFSYVYLQGQTDILFRQNTFGASSYVRKFGGGKWTMTNSEVQRGDIRHYTGVSYNDNLDVSSGGRLYLRNGGNNDIRNTNIDGLSFVDLQSASGLTRIWRATFSDLSYLYVRAAVTGGFRYFYSHNQTGSTFDYRSGTSNLTVSNNSQSSNGYVRFDGISGVTRLTSNQFDSRGELRLINTVGFDFYYNSISNYPARVYVENSTNPNIDVYYNQINSYGRVLIDDHANTFRLFSNNITGNSDVNFRNNSGPVTFQNNTVSSNFQLNVDDSSATINISENELSSRGDIDLNAITGTARILRNHVSSFQSRIQANATSSIYVLASNFNSQGRTIANGGQLDVRFSDLSGSSLYNTTNGTALNRLWYSDLHSLGRVNATGSYIYASTVGNNATLNALSFQFLRSRLHGLGTRTLTANNSNRYEFIGTNGLL
jgi:hypothetical protein